MIDTERRREIGGRDMQPRRRRTSEDKKTAGGTIDEILNPTTPEGRGREETGVKK